MKLRRYLCSVLVWLLSGYGPCYAQTPDGAPPAEGGQAAPAPAGSPAPAAGASNAANGQRDLNGYMFKSLPDMVGGSSTLARGSSSYAVQAMQLRDYCANLQFPEARLKQMLARFAKMTGKSEETCQTILQY